MWIAGHWWELLAAWFTASVVAGPLVGRHLRNVSQDNSENEVA